MERKYQYLKKKFRKLVHTQNQKPSTKTEFYPRVVDKTEISFTNEELTLLNKGLKCNINYGPNSILSTNKGVLDW
jgi:hypothetical protein